MVIKTLATQEERKTHPKLAQNDKIVKIYVLHLEL